MYGDPVPFPVLAGSANLFVFFKPQRIPVSPTALSINTTRPSTPFVLLFHFRLRSIYLILSLQFRPEHDPGITVYNPLHIAGENKVFILPLGGKVSAGRPWYTGSDDR